MDAAVGADATLKAIFLDQQWYRRSAFQATQQTIFNSVSAIFRRLTGQAVARRDSRAEYGLRSTFAAALPPFRPSTGPI
jgi:outer membrane cobalamin receptor